MDPLVDSDPQQFEEPRMLYSLYVDLLWILPQTVEYRAFVHFRICDGLVLFNKEEQICRFTCYYYCGLTTPVNVDSHTSVGEMNICRWCPSDTAAKNSAAHESDRRHLAVAIWRS